MERDSERAWMPPEATFLPEEAEPQFPDGKWKSSMRGWWMMMQVTRLLAQWEIQKWMNSISDMWNEVPRVEPRSSQATRSNKNPMSPVYYFVQRREKNFLYLSQVYGRGSVIKERLTRAKQTSLLTCVSHIYLRETQKRVTQSGGLEFRLL